MTNARYQTGRRLIFVGILLFLLGLFTGFLIPALEIPRMGLTSHLEGIMNGTFLVAIGLFWHRLRLPGWASLATFALAVYGAYANWFATLLAAYWGGGRTMPIAAGGRQATPSQEAILDFLLYSLSFAMIAAVILILIGLRGKDPDEAAA